MPSEKIFYERQDLKNGQLFQDIHIAHIEDGILNSFATMIPQMGPLDPSVDLTVADLKEMLAPGIYQLDGAKNAGLPYPNFYGTLIVWGGSHGAQIAIGNGPVEGSTKLKAYFRRRYSSTSQFSNWTTFDIEGTADTLVKNLKKLRVGNKSYNGQTEVTITASDLGLGNAVKFIGVTTSNIDDGSTLNPITINGNNVTAESGNVVLRNGFEYIWTDNGWERLGPDSNAVAAYGTCPTAAATVAKVITVQSNYWRLAPGSIIVIKFDNTNTASNPTFNVNNTGAKPVWYNTSNITTSNLSYAGYKDRYGEYIYDGEHYVFIGWSYDSNTTYTNASLGQGYSTCDTAEATIAKTATLSNYKLVAGGIVAIKFANAVPAAATLNINSTGAKAIYYKGAAIKAGIIKAGDTGTFIYDGAQYHLISVDGAVLTESGVTEGSYGPTANVTGSNNTKINIPQLTIDKYGRVTSASNKVYTSVNTDTNTTYDLTASKNSTNGNVKLNLTAGGSGSGTDSVTIKGSGATTVTTDANGIITIDSTGGSDVITGNYLPLTGGTLTGNLTLSPGSAYSHLGIDRTATDGVVHQLRTYIHVGDKSVHFEYFQNTDENSKVTLRLGDGYLWTNGNIIYRLPDKNHYTYYYNSDNKQVAVIRYNDNDTYHRFVFSHTDPSTGFYEAYVLPPREASVSDKSIVYDILTTKTIKASATALNYCSDVTSAVQVQLNNKVPITRTINSKALNSNITLTAADVGALASNGNAVSATKATQDGNGDTITSTYLKLSGGTLTDTLVLPSNLYTDDATTGGINCKNSNITQLNGLYFADTVDSAGEGIHFVTGSGQTYDTIYAKSGKMYFVPRRELGTTGEAYEVYHTNHKPTASDVGAMTAHPPYIEFAPNSSMKHGGYLDFHYNGSTEDYTSRIIEDSSGQLNINSMKVKNGAITSGTWNGSIIGATYGGTGQTSLKDSANALINALTTGSDAPKDTDYYVSQYAGGGTTTTTYHRRPVSALYNYIQGKTDARYDARYLKLSGSVLTNTCVIKKSEFKSDGTELTAVMVMRDHTTNNKNYLSFAITTLGTTSTVGVGSIILGNVTASGTAGNAKGNIKIYNEKTVACTLEVSADATARTIMLNRLLEVASWNSTTGTLTLK